MTKTDVQPDTAPTTLRNIALGLDPEAARELMEIADRYEQLLELRVRLRDLVTFWRDMKHPMLLAAAVDAENLLAAHAQAVAG